MSSTRQLAAIMFTDIVGYTALMGKDEKKAFDLLKKNRELQKPVIEQQNGRWIKELGDGVMASFNTVSDAVNAAIKIQETCNAAKDFQLRIGIHQGEVVFENDDVFGDGVNIASRIQAIAVPGGIYISESVYQNVSNKQDISTQFIKQETLKNVKDPVRIYEVVTASSHSPLLNEEPEKSREKSIAVLPFVNMSNDPDQEYFCDGITEEMINTLTINGGMRVIARTSAFAFKNKFIDITEIGRKLNVEYILEGSIRKSGYKIRLNAKLITVASGDHLWSGKFDRDLTDIFSIQDEIAVSISDQLKVLMQEKHLKPPTRNMEAFSYYLLGKNVASKGEIGWEKKSIELYENAIAKDPGFISAHASIALTTWMQELEGNGKDRYKINKHAKLALQLDHTNAEAHAAIALSGYHNEWKWMEAEKEFISAIQFNPHSVLALQHFGVFLSNMGRYIEAFKILNRALQADPLNTTVNQSLGWCYYASGDYAASKVQLQQTLRMEPTNVLAKIVLSFALIELHEFKEAESVLHTISEDNLFARTCLVWLYAAMDDLNKANAIIAGLEDVQNDIPAFMVWMNIATNNREEAFHWLQRALDKRDLMLMCLPSFNWWEPLRNDPRFDEVLYKTGLSEYLKTYKPVPI